MDVGFFLLNWIEGLVVVIVAVLGGFDRSGHGAFALLHEGVGTVAEDLIAFEFGAFFVGGVADDTTLAVDGHGDTEGIVGILAEEAGHHDDDVGEGVMAVIVENHVPGDGLLGVRSGLGDGLGDGRFEDCVFAHTVIYRLLSGIGTGFVEKNGFKVRGSDELAIVGRFCCWLGCFGIGVGVAMIGCWRLILSCKHVL